MKHTYIRRRSWTPLLVLSLALSYAGSGASFGTPVDVATPSGTYVAGGTAVVKEEGRPPRADEGRVVCSLEDGSGTGGACVPFGIDPATGLPGDSILVEDAGAGLQVAYQVCIDNNGDSVCTSPDGREGGTVGCADQVFFSHNDKAQFFNPLGPLPTSFQPGCPGGPYPGYIVFICNGVHNAGGAHAHGATTGRATLTSRGTGYGDFCGGVREAPTRKPYFVTTAALGAGSYVAGGTAVAKQSGQAPAADTGALACNGADGSGIGGACVAFGKGDSVLVNDAANGTDVAFQVCLDNNGDGVCTSPDFGPCADQIFFSHDDAGNFFNPLGKLPQDFAFPCSGGAWRGYVVFLCTGAHASGNGTAAPAAHVHPATNGTASLTSGGTGYGTFCGGARQNPSRKAYIVV